MRRIQNKGLHSVPSADICISQRPESAFGWVPSGRCWFPWVPWKGYGGHICNLQPGFVRVQVCAYMHREEEMAKKVGAEVFPMRRCGPGSCLSDIPLHVEPVITHAGSVPLAATVPAPLQPAVRLRTLHVHTSSIFFNRHIAARTRLSGFLDGFLRGLLPASLLGGLFVHSVGLRSSPRGFKQRVAFTFVVCFLTVPAENEPTAQAVASFTGDFPLALFRQQASPAARTGAQHAPHLQHTLLGAILLVPIVLLFSENPEVMELFNQGVGTASHTRQRVAKLSVMDKLPIVESCNTVQVEAVQADHMAVVTLEDQDGAPDVCTGYAGNAAAVTGDQVQSD